MGREEGEPKKMKELQVSPGDNVHKTFTKAWQVFWKLGRKEPVCFHHNNCRVIIMPDASNTETQILTNEEARKTVEKET